MDFGRPVSAAMAAGVWRTRALLRRRPSDIESGKLPGRVGEEARSDERSFASKGACARLCHLAGGELEQIQFLLGHVSVQTTERYLGCKQKLRNAVNDGIDLAEP